jgi:uridine kinase
MLIAIGGCSGSGKTVLTRTLEARLDNCSVLALDSYYHAQPGLSPAQRALRNYDHPDALDWSLLETHIQSLLSGEPAEVPVYQFDLHTRAPYTRRIHPSPIVLVEGILALHRPELRDRARVCVFVETPEHECFRRRLERDISERGRTQASVFEQYRDTVHPMALEFVLPSRAHAHVIVSGDRPVDFAVEEILGYLR